MARRFAGLAWIVVAALGAGITRAEEARLSGRLALVLEDAVFQVRKEGAAGPPTYLDLDLLCDDGQWRQDVYGWGWNLNRSEHYGRLLKATVDGDQIRLDTHLEIDGDQWVLGGTAIYAIELKRTGDKLTGTYKGKYRDRDVTGTVAGTLRPLPRPRQGHVPPEPGEHPRLLFRRSDLPALKKRADSDWGRPLIERVRAMTDDGLAMGLMYALTGEQRYANRCRDFLDREQRDTTGGAFNLGHEHGRRQMRMALAYDLAYGGLEDSFRARIAAYLTYYSARLSLRTTTFSAKTNLLPGSNYMAFAVAGPYVAQAALWDAPGRFPPEPQPPVVAKIDPPADFAPGQGVPIVKLEPGKTLTEWLFAGPFFAYADREDCLVLAERRKEPGKGLFYQQVGHDFLAALGGAAKARPQLGTKVPYHGRETAFAPLGPKPIILREGAKVIDVLTVHSHVPCSAGYYFAALQCDEPGWYRILLEPPNPGVKEANPYLGGGNAKFNPTTVALRLDATLFLAGQPLNHGDAVFLSPGTYPTLLRATTDQCRIQLQPRLEKTTEAEAQAALAARQAQFDKEHPVWEEFFNAYHRRPIYRIAERKVHRYDTWAQGDGGYQNETGAYHDYTMSTANLLAHVYQNMTGVRPPNIAMNLCCYVATDRGGSHQFAPGFSVVPPAYQPAVLWAWQRAKDFGEDPVLTFLNYPLDMAPKSPEGVLPSPYADRQMGWFLFRNGWRGKDTIAASIYYRSFMITGWNRPEAGSFEIHGLGHTWAWRGHDRAGNRYLEENVVQFPLDGIAVNDAWHVGPGRVTHFSGKPDGSGVVSGVLDDVLLGVKVNEKGEHAKIHDFTGRLLKENLRDLGLRHLRSFAADYSGASGAPALFAVADKTQGGKARYWQMNLPQERSAKVAVKVDGQTFTIQQGDATMRGTFLAPAKVEITHVAGPQKLDTLDAAGRPKVISGDMSALFAKGGDDFFVVMTLQRGAAPDVRVEGQGLAAKATLGAQTISFDGEKIIIGK